MDCQNIINQFKIIKDKDIGSVLYIVEGSKREFTILRTVFNKVLGYKEVYGISRNNRNYYTYEREEKSNSKIYIINTENSNISTIQDENAFVENQLEEIKQANFGFDYENIPIYYLFDCDRQEDYKIIEKLIQNFNNSREPNPKNEFNSIGGLLLLSYPSIESFIISNYEKDIHNLQIVDIKQYINNKKYNDNKLSIDTLSNSFIEMIKSVLHLGISEIDIDNFQTANEEIYFKQIKENINILLSLLLISFIDLGIIELDTTKISSL